MGALSLAFPTAWAGATALFLLRQARKVTANQSIDGRFIYDLAHSDENHHSIVLDRLKVYMYAYLQSLPLAVVSCGETK